MRANDSVDFAGRCGWCGRSASGTPAAVRGATSETLRKSQRAADVLRAVHDTGAVTGGLTVRTVPTEAFSSWTLAPTAWLATSMARASPIATAKTATTAVVRTLFLKALPILRARTLTVLLGIRWRPELYCRPSSPRIMAPVAVWRWWPTYAEAVRSVLGKDHLFRGPWTAPVLPAP